jgi:hypothetical protein
MEQSTSWLLEPLGDRVEKQMALFLSYATADEQAALEIVTRLGQRGFEVFHWQRQRGGRFIERIEEAINRADAFLALLSPNFLASSWCQLERELAMHRELDLRAGDASHVFIHVLQIAEMRRDQAGFLRNYDWLDLTTAEKRRQGVDDLTGRLGSGGETASAGRGASSPGHSSPEFRNRRDELDRVQRDLNNPSGPHFWLVIAPPGLGKSWFLHRLGVEMESAAPAGASSWATQLVDMRVQPLGARGDAARLLARLFGLPSVRPIEPRTLRDIAQGINKRGQPYLCLLDSAELLDKETGRKLRSCLSEIYDRVQRAGDIDVRLAFVVASRRDDEWRGVTPAPRLSPLSLTEFKVEVVRQALDDLATRMRRRGLAHTEFQQYAVWVHRLSEGLPALLVACLQWIQREQWHDLDRLQSQDVFEELAQPYIEGDLLSVDSLLPWGGQDLTRKQEVLQEAFRVLAPYRLFTQSHLRHHAQLDTVFQSALERLQWAIEDLWKAIADTALLSRPLHEPWQTIYAAIRRLLYRYYYKTDQRRASAHLEARKFVEVWADKQAGTEQVIGLVECLWHEAAMIQLDRPARLEGELAESARKRSGALRKSTAYTMEELRAFATEQMTNDEELAATVGHIAGLLERLVDIVTSP